MVEDKEFIYSFEKEIRNELVNAEQVVKNVFRKKIDRLEGSANEIIKAKADDLRDIYRKVLCFLLDVETNILGKLPEKSIIVARRLLPSDTVQLDQKNVEGIIVQEGSIHAHSALLARSLGIPALCTKEKSFTSPGLGETIIINGYTKKAILFPSPKTVENHYRKKAESTLEIKKRTRVIRVVPKTKKGLSVQIFANANTREEIYYSNKAGSDGIGLFRTEMFYLQSRNLPNEDKLFSCLQQAVETAGNGPFTFRLLDIGGDKRLPYFEFEEEFSPFLGLRGIRLLLQNPELLRTQIRALLRISMIKDIKILIPMVSVPDEITAVRKQINRCRQETGLSPAPKAFLLGSMVETPASAIRIKNILKHSDFISIGTNDLTQYIMAASRENPNVAELYEKGFEYLLPLIDNISKICRENKKECCVCGEMANNEVYLNKMIAYGVNQFSVAPFRIPHLKRYIRSLRL